MDSIVKETTEYGQFKLLGANREPNSGHVTALKKAFEEVGNLTMVQPILVNDRMEIIDGQHRYQACVDLGLPIFYTQVPGLGVHEARSMNILHREWRTDDYARSYANSGDPSYQRYLNLREEYGVSHSIILAYHPSTSGKGSFKAFREGQFNLDETDEQIMREHLDKLVEIGEYTRLAWGKEFAIALVKCMKSSNYNHRRMVKKIRLYGERLLKRFSNLEDTLRNLEELYNYNQTEDTRVRLY